MTASYPWPPKAVPAVPETVTLTSTERRWLSWLPFAGVVALALVVNLWGLSQTGYGNTYYAAAARSMSESWHAFFFAAFDPGGFITVDKPPVFLWVDALSVRIFGYSSWSLLAPSAVAGAAAVGLLWLIVRRHFGVAAASIAALVLALTPISVAVNRLNLPEPFYILALVGAAGCVLASIKSERWWAWTALAGILVGVAFNTKMLAAWIPGPALALAIVVGVQGELGERLPKIIGSLTILAVMTLAASASWMLVVDVWPEDSRPYVGGSTDNTVQDLVLGYNGLGRVEGNDGFGGGRGAPTNNRDGGGRMPPGGGNRDGGARGPGGIIAGAPDLWRMFDAANGGQIAWFGPFALLGGVIALWRWRLYGVQRAAVVLCLGWVALFAGVFSFAEGIYHSYYTAAIAPGLAALVGIGAVACLDLSKKDRRWLIAPIVLAVVTLWVQLGISGRFPDFFGWVRPLSVLAVVGGIALLGGAAFWRRLPAVAGVAAIVAGLLLLPGAWSGYETANASMNTTLPQAGPREGAAGRTFGSNAYDSGTAQLAAWLQEKTDEGARWDLVVGSAQQASTLIAGYDLSVMALGGFLGRDPTISPREFAHLIENEEVRYVLVSGGGGGGRNVPQGNNNRGRRNGAPSRQQTSAWTSTDEGSIAVLGAVQSACRRVSDRDLPSQYRNSLYDCAGAVSATSR